MQKKVFLCCFVLVFCGYCHLVFSQRGDIPILKSKLLVSTSDREKVEILNRLFFIYIFLDKDSAMHYKNLAFRLATQTKDVKGIAYHQVNEGIMIKLRGDYAGAMDKFLVSLYTFENLKDEKGIATLYNEIGLICTDQEHYALAEDYLNQSLLIRRKLKDEAEVGMCYYNLGNLYLKIGKLDDALLYHHKALKIRQFMQKDTFGTGHSLRCIGEVFLAKNELDSASAYCQKALAILANKKDAFLHSEIYSLQAAILQAQGKYEKALEAYSVSLDSAKLFSFQQQLRKVYKGIAECYAELAQPVEARNYLQKYIILTDSLSSTNSLEKVIRIKSDYEMAVKEKQILALEKDKLVNEEKLFFRNVLLLVSAFFLLLLGISLYWVYKYNRRYHHVNLLLKEKNDALLAQNEEIESQRDSLLKANENIKIQNEQIKEQRNDLKKLAENIGNYKDKMKAQRDALQKAYEKINLHKQQIKSQRNDLKRLIETITSYKDRLKKQQEKLITLNEEIKSLNEYLESKVQERTEELRKIIESLSKQNQDLEQFSYIISHNLRAPVARILGLVNIFDKENKNNEFNVQILNHLVKATRDLDTIIWDLTEVISIRNSFNLLKEQINIEELTQEVCNYLDAEIKNSHAQIHSNFEAKSIFSVKSYLQSILHNLLSNAIKFRSTRREPQIYIKTEYVDSFICLSIRDNGLGMDLTNTNQYKIFGLYQRMHEHVEGKGMGLFLVKTQIEALNGKIEVESKLNEGSVFKVYFPVKEEESQS